MKLGILISGRGSNMVAIIDAVKSGEVPDSEVAVVISEKPAAAGLEKARERGVETVVVERRGRSREEHDAEIIAELQTRGVELVCLAGYMRLLSKSFVRAFENKIVNIHPSLLPAFPGLDAPKQALEKGAAYSGCTVHFVDEGLDTGPIILQRVVEVKNDDDVETLSARILDKEHKAYVDAVRRIAIDRSWREGPDNRSIEQKLLAVVKVGLDTSMRGEGISLREALRRVGYKEFRKHFKASDLLPLLKSDPASVGEWILYSEDKRTGGGWWISDDNFSIGNLRSDSASLRFSTIEEAVAEYIIRELDFWADLN